MSRKHEVQFLDFCYARRYLHGSPGNFSLLIFSFKAVAN